MSEVKLTNHKSPQISSSFKTEHIKFAEVVVVLRNEQGSPIASDVWNFQTDSLVQLHYMIDKREAELNDFRKREAEENEDIDYNQENWDVVQIRFTETPYIWSK
jgi:hypothetical protein